MAWPLMQEHGFLGASIEDGRVMSYFAETPLDEALAGACLYDLTGNLYRFFSGDAVQSFAEAMCASRKLDAGSCAFTAVLTGDGALLSVPLLVRGGEHEYIVIDAGSRREALGAWMGFISTVEQGGRAPYASVSIEDASSLLVPLLLCGKRATELVRDYTADQVLPKPGMVASIAFDGVPCVLARLGRLPEDAFIVFAPPAFATKLFRSFLSFQYVHPQGMGSLAKLMGQLPWAAALSNEDRIEIPRDTLLRWGIIRPDADFIGARGLSEQS